MTAKEAIKILEKMKAYMSIPLSPLLEGIGKSKDEEAVDIAIEALEKQIPKKPEKVEDRYCKSLYTAYCPICHWMLARGNYRTGYVDTIHRNCPECLQRIDWTEGEG